MLTFLILLMENCIMNMLKYISKNYAGDEKTYIDRDGEEIVSSYRL